MFYWCAVFCGFLVGFGTATTPRSCENRGVRLEAHGLFSCFCLEPFWGAFCQFSCNRGTLAQDIASNEFFCSCQPGYTGDHCQTKLSNEQEQPNTTKQCRNNAIYRAQTGKCDCLASHFGTRCQFSCGHGVVRQWNSEIRLTDVLAKLWDQELSLEQLGMDSIQSLMSFLHGNLAYYYCECDVGFYGSSCQFAEHTQMEKSNTIPHSDLHTANKGVIQVSRADFPIYAIVISGLLSAILSLLVVLIVFCFCKRRNSNGDTTTNSVEFVKPITVKIDSPPPPYEAENIESDAKLPVSY